METKPKIELDLQQVEVLASRGLTKEQIADALGMSYSTLNRRQNDPEYAADLEVAIKRGKAKAISFVAGKLQKLIEEGNLGAICFYLKTQGGWSEKSEMTFKGDAKNPLTIDNRVPDLSPDQVMELMLKRNARPES
jgi:DNA-binding Xre family transcriptional regulator